MLTNYVKFKKKHTKNAQYFYQENLKILLERNLITSLKNLALYQ